MRRLVFISLCILFGITAQAQHTKRTQTSIRFTRLSWAGVLKKAKQLNKVIFVDAYASWCAPCKEMAAQTFTNAKVAGYFNANYINISLDMEKGDGLLFADKYAIASYPTVLFISPQGKVLTKSEGFLDDKELFLIVQKLDKPYRVSVQKNHFSL